MKKKSKKAQEGGKFLGTTNQGFAYNPSWKGQFEFGGNLPSAVGNMYARIGAPSNGKKAKKTKPSAKNGLQTYYQNGLDFQPKMMQEGGTLGHTNQKYKDPIEYTRDQYTKKLIPETENYVLSHFKNFPKASRVVSGTTIDEHGTEWPGMVVDVFEDKTNKSFGLNPLGQTAIYDQAGQLPATSKKMFQTGGKLDSLSNDIMLRQLFKESTFNEKATNPSGAKGLAQLKPIALKELKQKHKLTIDPLKPEDAIKGHKTLMTELYNKSWINKKNSPEEVKVAKALAAYNMGPTGLINFLNEQKTKGIDINKSTKWVESLPDEPKNYVNYITGANKDFNAQYKKALPKFKHKGAYPIKEEGGIIKDNMGQWAHPGEITEINSPNITMKGVNYPVLGVSDQNDIKLMKPNKNYKFKGKKVTEFPLAQNGLQQLSDYTGGQAQTSMMNWQAGMSGKAAPAMNQALQGINPQGMGGGLGGALGKMGGVQGILNTGTQIAQAVGQIKQEKQQMKQMDQFAQISGLVNQAAQSRPEKVKRKYTRPEDQLLDANSIAPTYGTGTNYLKNGGKVPQAFLGAITGIGSGMAGNAGGALGSLITGGKGKQTGGGMLGSTIGQTVGNFIPIPGAKQLLGFAGGLVGGLFGGKTAKKTDEFEKQAQANVENAAFEQGTANLQNQYSSFMEHGGQITNPQLITKFGDHSLKELLRSDPMMDTLRTGGNIRQNNMFPTDYFQMGGKLNTHWGGEAETISDNPYLGETVMFKGQSHDESTNGKSGIGITYGNSPVEVERGEPGVEMQDGGKQSLVVFGNMKIPNYGVQEIGDEMAKGKKFKTYVTKLSEKEARQNNLLDKSLETIDTNEVKTSFDKLKTSSAEASIIGANMKLKDIAKKKQAAASVQNAILETAKEFNLDSDSLAKGKVKKAKKGAFIENAQTGTQKSAKDPWFSKMQGYVGQEDLQPTMFDNILNPNAFNTGRLGLYNEPNPSIQSHEGLDWSAPTNPKAIGAEYSNPGFNHQIPQFKPGFKGGRKATKQESLKTPFVGKETIQGSYNDGVSEADYYPEVDYSFLKEYNAEKANTNTTGKAKNPFPWQDIVNSALPFLRPSNQMKLDPNQLMGEMYALSNNQLDPVQAQLYQPLLQQATDISLQDQMNANQADFNAMKKIAGNNPAALAQLAAQKYQANSSVLGEQFRLNQAQKMGTFNQNRQTLNDTQLKNLGILDQQYGRQSQAKSNTKATAQSALNSISDKIQKNKLENKTMGVMENLYNYRFGPKGMAYNMNPLVDFEAMIQNASPEELQNIDEIQKRESTTYNAQGLPTGRKKETRTTAKAKKSSNGSIVKLMK